MHVQLQPGRSANDCKWPGLSENAAHHHKTTYLTIRYWALKIHPSQYHCGNIKITEGEGLFYIYSSLLYKLLLTSQNKFLSKNFSPPFALWLKLCSSTWTCLIYVKIYISYRAPALHSYSDIYYTPTYVLKQIFLHTYMHC